MSAKMFFKREPIIYYFYFLADLKVKTILFLGVGLSEFLPHQYPTHEFWIKLDPIQQPLFN
jgi:hypothetical protein